MNILNQFVKSLYSPKDMAKYRFQGIGKTILYILLIALISIIPISMSAINNLKSGMNVFTSIVNDELPPFEIKNGKLHSDSNETIVLEKDDFTIIFDSTGEARKQSYKNKANAIALLKDEVVFIANGEMQATSYKSIASLHLSSDDIGALLQQIQNSLPLITTISVILIALFGIIVKFIEIFILAIFGLILRNITGHNLQYKHLWILSAYAVTIPTVFFTIMSALKTTVPAGFLINLGVSITILYLILKEINKDEITAN